MYWQGGQLNAPHNAEDAGKRVSEALKAEHPDWANTNADEFVKSLYSDPQSPH